MGSLAAVSDIKPRRSRGFQLTRRDGDRAFRAAVRHSRYIRFLRVAIPAGIALGLIGTFAASMLLGGPLGMLDRGRVGGGGGVVSGTKIMRGAPRAGGSTRKTRRYNLTANAAGQDLTKPDLVELHGIHAIMDMKDNAAF